MRAVTQAPSNTAPAGSKTRIFIWTIYSPVINASQQTATQDGRNNDQRPRQMSKRNASRNKSGRAPPQSTACQSLQTHLTRLRFVSAAARRCFPNNSRSSYVPCRRLKRATSRAVSLSTTRFFRSALLSRASLPCATPNSAFSFPLFQYNLRTTSAQPLTCVSP
jgi:hypothetical protein